MRKDERARRQARSAEMAARAAKRKESHRILKDLTARAGGDKLRARFWVEFILAKQQIRD